MAEFKASTTEPVPSAHTPSRSTIQAAKLPDDPELKAQVTALRQALNDSPGNPELDAKWNWSKATRDTDGAIVIPSTVRGEPSLVITERGAVRSQSCSNGTPLSKVEACADPERNEVIISPVSISKNSPETMDQKIHREALVIHELEHAKGASEYGAWTTHQRYEFESQLSEYKKKYPNRPGLLIPRPMTPDLLSNHLIRTHNASQVGAATAERFKDAPIDEARPWMPGGAKFNEAIEARAQLYQVLATSYGVDTPTGKGALEQYNKIMALTDPNSAEFKEYRKEFERGWGVYHVTQQIQSYERENGLTAEDGARIVYRAAPQGETDQRHHQNLTEIINRETALRRAQAAAAIEQNVSTVR